MAIRSGTRLGQYEVIAPLGAGGMGEVYRARDVVLKREVAIKILPPTYSSDPQRLQRFHQEAEATATLNHPNVLSLYHVGEHEGCPYLVTELLEGETLRERLRGGPLSVRNALDFGMQTMRGLAAAHEKGIIHRDLKPDNLFVTKDGRIKILDFGLAKLIHPEPEDDLTVTNAELHTDAGAVLGTVGYMAPEQVRGCPADTRADIFAFGAILYEMLTGDRAFKGATPADTQSAILKEEPPDFAALQLKIPPAVDRITRRCLEKAPERRFQSAQDLGFALEALSASSDSVAFSADKTGNPHKSQVRATRIVAIGLGLLCATLAILTVWWKTRAIAPQVENVAQLTHDGEPKPVPGAIASDGSRLYFKERRSGILGISQVSVAGGETALLSSNLTSPEVFDVAPDLSTLLVTFGTQDDTFAAMLPLPVGQMRKLLKADAAAFFPDGRSIAYLEGVNICVAQSDGSNAQKISELHGSLSWPAVAPGGQRIRFTALNDEGLSIWEVQTNGKGLHPVLPHWREPHFEFGGKWTQDGNYFIFQREEAGRWDLWAIPEKQGILSNSEAEPVRITNGPLSYGAPLPSRDGKQIFVVGSQPRGELIRYDSASKQFLPILGGMSVTDVMYSHDGKWLVYLSYPDHTLWRSRADGTERLQLTYAPMEVFYPHISPDGKQVVFSTWLPGERFQVLIVSMLGGKPRHVADGVPAAWSPDGKSLVFGQSIPGMQAGEPGFRELAILDLESGRISNVPNSRTKWGAFWPTQQLLVAGGEQDKLYSFDLATQTWSELTEGPVSNWMISPNSQYLYYIKETPGKPEAMRVRLEDRKIEVVASLQGVQRTSDPANLGESWVGVAPDGSLLLSRDIGTQEIYAIRIRWP